MLEMNYAARRTMALKEQKSVVPADRDAGIAIRPLPAEGRFSLRLNEASAAEIGQAAEFALDVPINSLRVSEGRHTLRLGPNEWLLIVPESDAPAVQERIETALAGHFFSLVDIGHRNVAIEVSGRHAPDVLNSGCPLDLDSGAFPTGYATRTLMGKAEIVLMRLDDTPRYRVECLRSFSSYVHAFLVEAAREFEQPAG